ncbi:unnamed protein product [Linum tenue]|uniref:Inositol oxygenase n=1 Tax=Linum tenue TaxID=586396 RepID=A0AAV0S7I9_9ROSI|nr:unnamed protein product [Linum tenue]
MTIRIEQSEAVNNAAPVVEQKNKVVGEEKEELVLDGGFVVPDKVVSSHGFAAPDINAFGNSFRNYNAENERQKTVENLYREQHTTQTLDFVKKMRAEYGKLNRAEMSIWDCCELLNSVVDDSDPDLDEPQIQHLLQSAEAIRKDYPNEDWLHLTALIHDLGKILLLPQFGGLPQWAVVGDTFPLGCAFDESNVHHKYFAENPDSKNPIYSTKNGVYKEGCGLDSVYMSWGHDDYMYLVAKENKTTLPSAALFIVRYHSFYRKYWGIESIEVLVTCNDEFCVWYCGCSKYDLYSKSKVHVDVAAVKPYYQSLIAKVSTAKSLLGLWACISYWASLITLCFFNFGF